MTNPNLNRLKRTPTASPRPRFQLGSAFFRHPGASRNLVQHCEPSLRRSVLHPSFRRKPESMPAGPITISPNRHPVSPNRHSGLRRNPGRKETLPPAPAKFPISQSNLPESTHHPKSGHTSALQLAPTPGHRLSDPAPSHFAPLPGILDVGDAGSRFGCPPPAPSAPPSKIPKIPAQ